ncbi:hypothetical protein [Streptomyces sp. IBSNAI001]|uniref:hypothetical protein n=1 Tax=Streptomyces sp. IBSNAI001 TaxID=3457499 RepID=UPI003FD47950
MFNTYKITLKTTTGYEDYTVTAHTPQEAEISATELYLLQNPAQTVRGAERNGSMTTAPYSAPDGVEYPVSRTTEPAGVPRDVKPLTPGNACPALTEPGNIHVMVVGCVDCNAFRMSKMDRKTVERWYHTGHFGQADYEAYMHVWATSSVRHSAGAWMVEPTIPKVVEIVAAIRRHAGIPTPAVLAA